MLPFERFQVYRKIEISDHAFAVLDNDKIISKR